MDHVMSLVLAAVLWASCSDSASEPVNRGDDSGLEKDGATLTDTERAASDATAPEPTEDLSGGSERCVCARAVSIRSSCRTVS